MSALRISLARGTFVWTADPLLRHDGRVSKPRVKAPPTPAAGASVPALQSSAVKVRDADKRRAEALLAGIARRKVRISEDFYEIGLSLSELLKKKLYFALGHGSFEEMLKAHDVMSWSRAKQLIEIVDTMDREHALALGSEKAYALARYSAATPEPDTPEWLLSKGVKLGDKPIAEASLREIKEATRDVRKKASPRKPASPEAKAAEDAKRALSAWLGKKKVKGATIAVRKRKGAFVLVVEIGAEHVAKVVGP